MSSLIADDAASGTIANAALILGAAIEGFGVSGGGTLTIESGQTITITDQPSDDGALDLAPSLFSTGFSNYDVHQQFRCRRRPPARSSTSPHPFTNLPTPVSASRPAAIQPKPCSSGCRHCFCQIGYRTAHPACRRKPDAASGNIIDAEQLHRHWHR